jgi:hypothetical protein
VQWAGVIGQAEDFSRNWSYTALSRAREPTRVFLIDLPTRAQLEREEIAPDTPRSERDPVERLSRRMRERDDEDLALEQLERAQLEPEAERDAAFGEVDRQSVHLASAPTELSTARAQLRERQQQLRDVRDRLSDPRFDQAEQLARVDERTAAITAEQQRDRKPRGRQDRAAHRRRSLERERQLVELRERREQLSQTLPNPPAVPAERDELLQRRQQLLAQTLELRAWAIEEELHQNPTWLEKTIGPEPQRPQLRARWQRTARELAAYRIDHDLTNPDLALDPEHDPALARSISDTRALLGLDPQEHGHGHER